MTTDTLEKDFATPVDAPYGFTARDRCDGGYSEQAYHRATKGDQELFFCNHHYVRAEEWLLLSGWTIESDVRSLHHLGNPLDAAAY